MKIISVIDLVYNILLGSGLCMSGGMVFECVRMNCKLKFYLNEKTFTRSISGCSSQF